MGIGLQGSHSGRRFEQMPNRYRGRLPLPARKQYQKTHCLTCESGISFKFREDVLRWGEHLRSDYRNRQSCQVRL